jgi:hypothetical protein
MLKFKIILRVYSGNFNSIKGTTSFGKTLILLIILTHTHMHTHIHVTLTRTGAVVKHLILSGKCDNNQCL